jgi:hypothetical protein
LDFLNLEKKHQALKNQASPKLFPSSIYSIVRNINCQHLLRASDTRTQNWG